MLRFVRTPEGDLCFDSSSGKLPGRGVWMQPKREFFETAVAKNLFSKSFGEKTRIPADYTGVISKQLQDRIFSLLGLARKAGDLVIGALKITQAVKEEEIAFVIAASDSSAQERKKWEHKVPVYLFGTKEDFSNLTLQAEQAYLALKFGTFAQVVKDVFFKYMTFSGKEGL